MIEMYSAAAHLPTPKIGVVPAWVMRALGLVSGPMKELGDTLYQFRYPYILDTSHSERVLGLEPTPLADGTAATIAWWKADKPAVSV
jgi:nucleoside-diphosphate-sugar epimerase